MKETQLPLVSALFDKEPDKFGGIAPIIFASNEEYDIDSMKVIPFRQNSPL